MLMCKTSCSIFTKGNYLTQRQFVTGRLNWIVSLVGFARLYLKHPNQESTANLSKLKNVQVQRRSSSEVLPNKSHARGMADLWIKGFDLQVLFTTHIIHLHFPSSGQGGSVVVRQHVSQTNVLLSAFSNYFSPWLSPAYQAKIYKICRFRCPGWKPKWEN